LTIWINKTKGEYRMIHALAAVIAFMTFSLDFGQVIIEDLLPLNTPPQKVIALTFDDGPNPSTTPTVLAELEKRKITATFFLIGIHARDYPDIVKRMDKDGFEIENHTWEHLFLPHCSNATIDVQLNRTTDLIEKITSKKPHYVHPPMWGFDKRTMAESKKCGIDTTLWTIDPSDWQDGNTNHVVTYVLSRASAGDIVLLHDIHPTTVAAVPIILDSLSKKGFKFVTVSELLKIDQKLATEGKLDWRKKAEWQFPGLIPSAQQAEKSETARKPNTKKE